jgi:hypothetical protein
VGVSVLQGTFETLSLPEVLGLLASARKSGALWLDAGPVSGVVHLQDGHCHAAETGEQRGPVTGGALLLPRLVDMCFAVMCQESGSFRFAADDPAPWTCADPVELSDVLVEVDRLLKQWREILRVIPSLECRPQLLDALEVDELVFDRERWTLLVAVDGRRTVRELVQRTSRPVIELCQSLLELIEAGALGVIDPAAVRPEELESPEVAAPEVVAPEVAAPEVAAPEVVAPEVVAPEVVAPEVVAPEVAAPEIAPEPVRSVVLSIVPADGADVEPEAPPAPEAPTEPAERAEGGEPETVSAVAGSEPPDKGAFLRLFSGLRDS